MGTSKLNKLLILVLIGLSTMSARAQGRAENLNIRAIDSSDRIVSVSLVFASGDALVRYEGGLIDRNYTRRYADLSPAVPCAVGNRRVICVNNVVKFPSDHIGIVQEIFQNGRAKVMIGDHAIIQPVFTLRPASED